MLFGLIAMASCRRAAQSRVERIAIVPFENVSNSKDLDWASPALAQLLSRAVAGSRTQVAFVAADLNEAHRGRATRIVAGTISGAPDRIWVAGSIRDADGRTLRTISANGDVISVAKDAARQLRSDPRDPGVASPEAARLFGMAQLAPSAQQAAAFLEQCVARSPGFADAHLALARLKGTPPEVPGSVKLDAIDSARIRLAQARTAEERIGAAEQLAGALPADPEPSGAAGMILLSLRQYDRAAVWLRKATALDPEAPEHWNTLAYVLAYSGDLQGAVASLAEYSKRRAGGNSSDSLGEIYFMHGKFAESEKAFLEAYQKEPALLGNATLRKAAEARRMAGDQKGADAIFQRYLDAQSQHPWREVMAAQWDYSSGRTKEAISRAEKFAREKNSSVAWAQLAVWRRAEKASGAAEAKRAIETSTTGPERLFSALAYFVTMPDGSAEEWLARGEKVFGPGTDPRLRSGATGYALLLGGHFREALPIVKQLWAGAPVIGANEWTAPLAWALAEAGQRDEMRQVLKFWPIPESQPDSLFQAWTWTQVQRLKKL